MQKIDDAAYAEGRRQFNTGASIRQIIERIIGAADKDVDDGVAESAALGFIDAAFDRLRGITR